MSVQIKFCGLTRADDVAEAANIGANYLGVIFAGGIRNRTASEASAILGSASNATRVGVFGSRSAEEIMRYVSRVPLSVVQLHREASAVSVTALRNAGATAVWAVVPVAEGELTADAQELFLTADAVVLDTGAADGLGGTGRSFDWRRVAGKLADMQRTAKLVVAGGLNVGNVAEAIRVLRPDIVDVSSGVESSPGVKDPKLMRRFADAARSA